MVQSEKKWIGPLKVLTATKPQFRLFEMNGDQVREWKPSHVLVHTFHLQHEKTIENLLLFDTKQLPSVKASHRLNFFVRQCPTCFRW